MSATAENTSCACPGPGYASPQDAIKAPREKVVYTVCIYTGTGIEKPDYLATIDVDEDSDTYGQVISRCEMPTIGDELRCVHVEKVPHHPRRANQQFLYRRYRHRSS